jgi:hypothetical protein
MHHIYFIELMHYVWLVRSVEQNKLTLASKSLLDSDSVYMNE